MSAQGQQAVAIVGGGQAGFQSAASLRELGFAGGITIWGYEPYLPYQRPPLSKTYLRDDSPPDKMYFRPARFFAEKNITVREAAPVAAIDTAARTLTLADGSTATWDHLVIATGVTNRRLPVPGATLDGVVMLRGLDDAHVIRARLPSAQRIVVVGGGVIGLEIAAMARSAGKVIDVVEAGDRLAGRIGSEALSRYFLDYHRGLGSTVHLSAGVAAIEGRGGRVETVVLASGDRIAADLVLVCIGVTPNSALAEAGGIACQDGILVDAHMRTSAPGVLAAGDCARFKPAHGPLGSVRLESVQNAIDQGRCAAETITGKLKPYTALPWFWSDQGSLKLQIAGLTAGHDHAIVVEDRVKGTMAVYCFFRGKLIGVECVNRPADFMAARRVLGAGKAVSISDVEKLDFELKSFMA